MNPCCTDCHTDVEPDSRRCEGCGGHMCQACFTAGDGVCRDCAEDYDSYEY